MLRLNGFEITDAEGGATLTAVPFSRNTTFGAADVLELVALLNTGDAAPLTMGRSASDLAPDTIVRPSKCALAKHCPCAFWRCRKLSRVGYLVLRC